MTLRSFRDPAGWLEDDGERIVRHIAAGAQPELEALLASPLYARLTETGLLIPGRQLDASRLEHARVELPTYPFEWTPAMLADAARLTLRVQSMAWAQGWTLKDASAHNILFDRSTPRLCDLLSLQPRRADDPPGWAAYGQFVRHFVLPLLAIREQGRHPRDIFLARRDGLRASEVAPFVRWHRHLGLAMWLHVRLPARLERRRIGAAARPDVRPQRAPVRDGTPWLLGSLEALINRLAVPRERHGAWSAYTGNRDHYAEAELAAKRAAVQAVAGGRRHGRALDIGANNGEFAELLAPHCDEVVALDEDLDALDELYRRAPAPNVLCLHANIARETPPTGWRLGESRGLSQRFERRFDLILMLAVVHHLIVTERLPLAQLFETLAGWCTGTLLIEFVSRDDPRFIEIAGPNMSLYTDWSLTGFLAAAEPWFVSEKQTTLSPHRQLLQLKRR
ncbi:class I SAM-dependent methyltransferase [Roseateles sp. P5_E11]